MRVYDPILKDYPDSLDDGAIFSKDPYEALKGANLMVLVTEWDEFLDLDFERIKSLLINPNIIDGRNFLDKKKLQDIGFKYVGIGN